MKKRVNKKLILNKKTIAALKSDTLWNVKAGGCAGGCNCGCTCCCVTNDPSCPATCDVTCGFGFTCFDTCRPCEPLESDPGQRICIGNTFEC